LDSSTTGGRETSAKEPVLASLIYATILSEPSFEDAVCQGLRGGSSIPSTPVFLHKTFHEVLTANPGQQQANF
jgi:Serine acetyltransferase, N-terminal